MLIFFTTLTLMVFQVRYLTLFFLLSVVDGFRCFWMGSLHKNIQLKLLFFKGPFLVLHFSHYTLMTFLMMLSVILLSMLMMVLFTLNVIRHLICRNSQDWLLNWLRNTVDRARKWLVDFSGGKTQLISFDRSNNGLMLGLTFSSKWIGFFHYLYC